MFYVSSHPKGYYYLLILIGCDLNCQNTYSDLCNAKRKFIIDLCDKELLVMYVAIEGFGEIWQGSTVQKFCWVQNFCTVGRHMVYPPTP